MNDSLRHDEFVVRDEEHEGLVVAFRDFQLNAYVYRRPFGMKLPKSWLEAPSEGILVGGSVSAEFAVPAILLARKLIPELKFILLSSDKKDVSPEDEEYEIILRYPTEHTDKYKCKAWTDEDFEGLKEISRQSDFHYYLRSFYRLPMGISRHGYTLIKYFGGIHDGEVSRMAAPPEAILALPLNHGRIGRQDGTGVDVYLPKINGDTIEFHFDRTEKA